MIDTGQKNHYPFELLLKAIKMYLEEGLSQPVIMKELGIRNREEIKVWVRRYRLNGEMGLRLKRTNGSVIMTNKKIKSQDYSPAIKLKAVRMFLQGATYQEVLTKYNISDNHLLYDWKDLYISKGEMGLKSKNKKGSNEKSPNYQSEETNNKPLWKQIKQLEMENDLLKNLLSASRESSKRK